LLVKKRRGPSLRNGKVSFAKFNDSLKNLFFGVHHERPALHDRFAENSSTITGESHTGLLIQYNHRNPSFERTGTDHDFCRRLR